MGADLTYTCLGGNQYLVRLSFYRDCAGITPSSSYFVSVGSNSCGQSLSVTLNQLAGYPIEVSPLCPAQLPNSTCNGGNLPGVEQYIYEGIITLPAACNDWTFGWSECCRNAAITTLSSPDSQNLFVSATLNNLDAPCNSSPQFTSLPVPYICAGQPYIYNHGAVDADGDSLVYSLVNAYNTAGVPVTYNGGFSGTNPISSTPPAAINPANGNVTMTPAGTQIAVIAVQVDEYRDGILIGSTIRDIQVTVLNCSNVNPTINSITGLSGGVQTGPYSVEICPGQALNFTIPGTDPDAGQSITWSWNNGIPGGSFTGPTGGSPQNATFSWTPSGGDVGLHSLTVTLADNACPVLGQQTRAIDIIVLQGTTAGPDQVYCTSGGPVALNAVGGSSFTWNILSGTPGSLSCTNCASPNATPSVTTVYEVVSNLSSLCRNRDTVAVTIAPSFALTMGPNTTICQNGSASLSATPSPTGAYTYSWAPTATLSSGTVSNPTATPTTTTAYNVTVTSAAGCEMTGTQTITVSNAALGVAPTANPTQSCAGAPVTLNANATTGNCNQYTVSSIPFVSFVAGGTTLSLSDDMVSSAVPIGFNFNFFCNTYSNVYVSSNGFITFNPASGTGCCGGQFLPDANDPNGVIAAAWDDLYPPGNGTVSYQTLGTIPNRRFVVTYSNVPFCCGSTPDVSSQIILYETSNNIEVHVANVNGADPGTIGIENMTGTAAFTPPNRNSSTWTTSNEAWLFAPSVATGYTLNWQAPLGTTIGTGNSLAVTPSATTTYYAVADNGICTATAPVTVDVARVDAGPDINLCPAGQNANLNATYIGPPPPSNCNAYTVSNIVFAPVASAGTPVSLSDDAVSSAIPIGFNFTFFCNNYSNLYISSNGFVTFNAGSGSGCCAGQIIPDANDPNNLIAATWDDLYPPGAGSVTYQTVGTAPNRRFVVTYGGIPFCCGSTADVRTQIILYETTNVIEIHTTNVNGTDSGTMGIENALGNSAYVVNSRNSTAWSANNEAWRFSPQVSNLNVTWSPATFLNSTTILNPTAVNVTGDISYTVTVDNGTCILVDSLNVTICLPVDNVVLHAASEGDDVRLDWEAVNEVNVGRYEIERSGDGEIWEKIGEVASNGQTNPLASYRDYDRSPLTGMNVYRLRVVDLDGALSLSNTAEVTFGAEDWMSVTPNPGQGLFAFDLHLNTGGELYIDIFSVDGKQLQHKALEANGPGYVRVPMDLHGLPVGTYLYQVRTTKSLMSGRLMKVD